MADLSVFGANQLLDWQLATGNPVRPDQIYAALYLGPHLEVSGSGYSRQPITFSTAENGSTSNVATVSFTAVGAGWGDIVYIGLLDAATGGNLLWQGLITNGPKTAENGDTLDIQFGALTVLIT